MLLLSQKRKAGEMSVGCHKTLSGCSHGKITLLKAIERSFSVQELLSDWAGVFYCLIKDSAVSELEI